jgi:hypothetical protein
MTAHDAYDRPIVAFQKAAEAVADRSVVLGLRAPSVDSWRSPIKCFVATGPARSHGCRLPFAALATGAFISIEKIRLFLEDAGIERLELEPAAEWRADYLIGLHRRLMRYQLQRLVGAGGSRLGKQLHLT